MSYDPEDAAMDEFYDLISKELYPEHKEQAIEEFTDDKLKSYYQDNPDVMRPAVDAIQEGNWQLKEGRYLGHSTIAVTERYAHLAQEHKQAAAALLDRGRK